jgi:hypothetical protein
VISDTLSDLQGIELDAAIAQSIIDSGNEYSQQTADLAQFINKYKQYFRENLLSRQLIQVSDPSIEGFDLAAVDGASAAPPHGGGALVVAAAYKCTINDEKQRGSFKRILLPNSPNIEAFATLARIHLEFSLLARENIDYDRLVILDQSFHGVMEAVSRGLAAYKSQRRDLVSAKRKPESNKMQLAWKELFQECLSQDGSFHKMIQNKQVISLSKTAISQYFVNLLQNLPEVAQEGLDNFVLASALNDRALLRHILEPGEYTTPVSIYFAEREQGTARSRKRFATTFEEPEDGDDPFSARDNVLNHYGVPQESDGNRTNSEIEGYRIFFTYYRPHPWSRTYRIEFHEIMLLNKNAPKEAPPDFSGRGERFQKLLDSVKKSVGREAMEPICQVLADMRSKAAVAVAASTLPERSFYQLRDKYRNSPDMLDIIDTLLAEERT